MKLIVSISLFLSCIVSTARAQCWQTIASSFDKVLAIHEDGTLWTWGGNRQSTGPIQIGADNDWVAISSGEGSNAALKSDGTLWMWGDNSYGQLGQGTQTNLWTPTQVGSDNNWSQVSCGQYHTAAIKTDGTLWLWGRNDNGQMGAGLNRANRLAPTQLGTDTNWVEISAGRSHTLIRKTTNAMWFVGACYSSSINSQLRQVGSALDWKTMGAGAYTDYGIKQNGTLWKWVNSNGGPSGLSQIGNQNNWNKIGNYIGYSTEAHALFIKTNGTMWAVGKNHFGQLGNGSVTDIIDIPQQIGTDTDWKQVVAGSLYSLALKTDNSFWAWGRNQHAQFGNGHNKNKARTISNESLWKNVIASKGSFNGHTMAIHQDGTLWSWGPNQDGQLGIGPPAYVHKALPQQVGSSNGWKQITAGFHFSIGIKEDGTMWGWGRNGSGQIGLGGLWSTTTPTQIGTDTTWVMAASSASNTIAIKDDGTLWAFGFNQNGELGIGNTQERDTPVQVGNDSTWVYVAAGDQHSMAIKSDGSLWSWGNNTYGQLGRSGPAIVPNRVGTDTWLKVAGGGLHTLGIKSDSTLWSWGRNNYAQLGDGGTNNKNQPYQINSEHKWKNLSGGYEHSLATTVDSTLWVWGRNAAGNLTDSISYVYFPNNVYTPLQILSEQLWMDVSGGVVSSSFIQANGKLYTCGDSYSQDFQTNFPVLGYVDWLPQQFNVCNSCPASSYQYSQSICAGDSILFNGSYRFEAGYYSDTLMNYMGCDSLITLSLVVNLPAHFTDVQQACESFEWIDGITYSESNNTAIFVYENGASNGCDSIVHLDLIMTHPIHFTDVQQSCESFEWIDGITYLESNNTALFVYENGASNGCDSIVHLDLTITHPIHFTDAQQACESFEWIDGMTYSWSNNTAIFVYENGASNGCDSIVHLDLIMTHPIHFTDVQQSCESFTWIDGITYSESNNIAIFVYENGASNGCDSIVHLDLTITHPIHFTDVQQSCESFTWIDGITYSESNNTALFVYENGASNGCDSIVHLDLTITPFELEVIQQGITLIAESPATSYQWIDCATQQNILSAVEALFIPEVSGVYAVQATNGLCSAQSDCIDIIIANIGRLENKTYFNIFPNPASNQVTIVCSGQFDLEILDISGKRIMLIPSALERVSIDINSLPAGVYMVRSISARGISTKKLIIQVN
jgi:alpha-tubulin suppressor-like RCC1 family protein